MILIGAWGTVGVGDCVTSGGCRSFWRRVGQLTYLNTKGSTILKYL